MRENVRINGSIIFCLLEVVADSQKRKVRSEEGTNFKEQRHELNKLNKATTMTERKKKDKQRSITTQAAPYDTNLTASFGCSQTELIKQ